MKPLKIQMSILVTNEYLGTNGYFGTRVDQIWLDILFAPEVHGTCVRRSPGNRVKYKALRDHCFFSLAKFSLA